MTHKDPTKFRQRFLAWKNGELVYDKGKPTELPGFRYGTEEDNYPVLPVKNGDVVDTDQCATWSNGWLRNIGYLTHGNAWNLKGIDTLFNGFEGMAKPSTYDRAEIEKYNHAAADSVYKKFDSSTLDKSLPYAVNMFYNGSPAQEEAYKNGDKVTGTHTGVLTFNPTANRWYVTHNIHGKIHSEPFVPLLSGKGKYGVTAIYLPRKKSLVNKVKGLLGFAGGKEDGEIVTNYSIPFIPEKAITLSNAGLATGAILSTNLLDTLADNAIRASLPVKTALGLAVKESTLGNPTDDRSMRTLLSENKRRLLEDYLYETYGLTYEQSFGQHINHGYSRRGNEVVGYWRDNMKNKPEPPLTTLNPDRKSVVQKAFEDYKKAPHKYNPGQKNYQKLVDKRAEEVWKSPEIQEWWKQRNLSATKNALENLGKHFARKYNTAE